MKKIVLPLKIVNQILAHAQSQAEEEICGLIAEHHGEISAIYPIQNIAVDRENLYRMDGKSQIDAMRHMREKDQRLYAIYHSHPHSVAYPSARDVNEVQYQDVVYLIISLDIKGVLDLRGYRLKDREIEVLKVVV